MSVADALPRDMEWSALWGILLVVAIFAIGDWLWRRFDHWRSQRATESRQLTVHDGRGEPSGTVVIERRPRLYDWQVDGE